MNILNYKALCSPPCQFESTFVQSFGRSEIRIVRNIYGSRVSLLERSGTLTSIWFALRGRTRNCDLMESRWYCPITNFPLSDVLKTEKWILTNLTRNASTNMVPWRLFAWHIFNFSAIAAWISTNLMRRKKSVSSTNFISEPIGQQRWPPWLADTYSISSLTVALISAKRKGK